jgi:hypothetical protein
MSNTNFNQIGKNINKLKMNNQDIKHKCEKVEYRNNKYYVITILKQNKYYIVDFDKLKLVKKHKNSYMNNGYIMLKNNVYLHNIIMNHKPQKGGDNTLTVDHINRKRNDNRVINFMLSNQTKQNINRKKIDRKIDYQNLYDNSILPEQLPTKVEYRPKRGKHGEHFNIRLSDKNSDIHFRDFHSSKNINLSLRYKFEFIKKALRYLVNEEPDYFIDEYDYRIRLNEYYQILKKAGIVEDRNNDICYSDQIEPEFHLMDKGEKRLLNDMNFKIEYDENNDTKRLICVDQRKLENEYVNEIKILNKNKDTDIDKIYFILTECIKYNENRFCIHRNNPYSINTTLINIASNGKKNINKKWKFEQIKNKINEKEYAGFPILPVNHETIELLKIEELKQTKNKNNNKNKKITINELNDMKEYELKEYICQKLIIYDYSNLKYKLKRNNPFNEKQHMEVYSVGYANVNDKWKFEQIKDRINKKKYDGIPVLNVDEEYKIKIETEKQTGGKLNNKIKDLFIKEVYNEILLQKFYDKDEEQILKDINDEFKELFNKMIEKGGKHKSVDKYLISRIHRGKLILNKVGKNYTLKENNDQQLFNDLLDKIADKEDNIINLDNGVYLNIEDGKISGNIESYYKFIKYKHCNGNSKFKICIPKRVYHENKEETFNMCNSISIKCCYNWVLSKLEEYTKGYYKIKYDETDFGLIKEEKNKIKNNELYKVIKEFKNKGYYQYRYSHKCIGENKNKTTQKNSSIYRHVDKKWQRKYLKDCLNNYIFGKNHDDPKYDKSDKNNKDKPKISYNDYLKLGFTKMDVDEEYKKYINKDVKKEEDRKRTDGARKTTATPPKIIKEIENMFSTHSPQQTFNIINERLTKENKKNIEMQIIWKFRKLYKDRFNNDDNDKNINLRKCIEKIKGGRFSDSISFTTMKKLIDYSNAGYTYKHIYDNFNLTKRFKKDGQTDRRIKTRTLPSLKKKYKDFFDEFDEETIEKAKKMINFEF